LSADTSTIEDTVVRKLRDLPPERQREVADFVEFIDQRSVPRKARKSLEGLWAGRGSMDVTEEDIAEARREMWSR